MGQSIASKLKPEEVLVLRLLSCGQTLSVDDLAEHLGCEEGDVRERMAYLSTLTGCDFTVPSQWGHA